MFSLARQIHTKYAYHESVNQQIALGPGIMLRMRYTEPLLLKKIDDPVMHKSKYFPGNFKPFTEQAS